ncbi:MAG: 7-cyano-7-deazaguanine synthase QueC [Verrucomicrobiota bacterium]|nr:7-cyano-7-deazaguanine synthase QueC [Verrucomicrobiota bacterium]
MKKAIIILSGGMDSGVLLADYTNRMQILQCIFFDYGSKHNHSEKLCAKKLAKTYEAKLSVIELPFISEHFDSSLLKSSNKDIPEGHYQSKTMKSTVVPFRNGIMLSIAAGFAESANADIVLIGSHAGDHAIYPDCRPEFTRAFSDAVIAGTYNNIKIYAPYSNLTKLQIAERGRTLDFSFEDTWSCYKGENLHCGVCGTCVERKEALGYTKGTDPTEYKS